MPLSTVIMYIVIFSIIDTGSKKALQLDLDQITPYIIVGNVDYYYFRRNIMKTFKCTFVLLLSCILIFTASCSDDGGSSGGGADESTQIDSTVAGMSDYPEGAQATEAESFNVNGEEVTGTDSTSVETNQPAGDVSVTLPSTLARAGESITVFGYWFNGKMTKTPVVASFADLLGAMQVIFTEYLDSSATDKIKIDKFPLVFDNGDNYFFFYFEDSSGAKYRTPIVKIVFDPSGGLLKVEEMDELTDFEYIDE